MSHQQAKDLLAWVFRQPLRQIPLLLQIIEIVRRRQRQVPDGRGVLPITVQAWLDRYVAEQTLRRLMAALWRAGLLERPGGVGSRKGYRVVAA